MTTCQCRTWPYQGISSAARCAYGKCLSSRLPGPTDPSARECRITTIGLKIPVVACGLAQRCTLPACQCPWPRALLLSASYCEGKHAGMRAPTLHGDYSLRHKWQGGRGEGRGEGKQSWGVCV